jgi:hypothetical protein
MRRSFVAGIVLVVALGACGSGQAAKSSSSNVSTAELVAAAPTAAADAKSAHISGSMTIDVQGHTIDVPLSADTDFATGDTAMTMDMSGISGMPSGGGTFAIRMVDGVMYMGLDALLGGRRPAALAGKEWVEIDTSDLGVSSDQLTNQNPADVLESLRGAGKVDELGTQEIDGVETTHFRAQIDTSKALARLSDRQREQAGAFLTQMGSSYPMDVWIDSDGLPRRFELNLTITGTGSVAMRMDFSHYGEAVDVGAPPADSTISMQDLQALGASSTRPTA